MKGYARFLRERVEGSVIENTECPEDLRFYPNPFDALAYNGLINDFGFVASFVEVESLDDPYTEDGREYYTEKLRVGPKLQFEEVIERCVNFALLPQNEEGSSSRRIASDETDAKIVSAVDGVQIGTSGDYARIGSSGGGGLISAAGFSTQIGSAGYGSKIACVGEFAQIASDGGWSTINSTGKSSQICSVEAGAKITSAGQSTEVVSVGDDTVITCMGKNTRIVSSGHRVQINCTGDYSRVSCAGNDSVVVCTGLGASARAEKGCWITLAEWLGCTPVRIKTEFVDGERIKPGRFYKLENGEFTWC